MIATGKRANHRLAILMDADNLEIQGNRRRRINLKKLLERMNGRELVRAIYYCPTGSLSERVQHAVERAGLEVKRTFKNSDAWIITDALALAAKCDVVAFVGGDGDLEPVIIMLRALGVRTEVWSWEDCISKRVKALVDEFVPLTPDLIVKKRMYVDRKRVVGKNSPNGVAPRRSGEDGDEINAHQE